MQPPLRFDRNEWAGSCGDSGTDLPLHRHGSGGPPGRRQRAHSFRRASGSPPRLPDAHARPATKAMAAIVIAQKIFRRRALRRRAGHRDPHALPDPHGAGGLARPGHPRQTCGDPDGLGIQLAPSRFKTMFARTAGRGTASPPRVSCWACSFLGDRRMPAALLMVPWGWPTGGLQRPRPGAGGLLRRPPSRPPRAQARGRGHRPSRAGPAPSSSRWATCAGHQEAGGRPFLTAR